MKYKKGKPIMCLDDLITELNHKRPVFQHSSLVDSDSIWRDPFTVIVNYIKNRDFYYAEEDE